MYDIAILTSAIIRPKLHNVALASIKNIITKEMSIYWIINIDFVNTLPKHVNSSKLTNDYKEKCLDFTEKNIRKIFNDYNITFAFIKNIDGNFNIAVRNIINTVKLNYNKIKYGILYLEDDWVVNKFPNKYNINYYFDFLQNTSNCLGISFVHSVRIGFKPILWNKSYFEEIFCKSFSKLSKINIDPEQLIRSYNRYGFTEEHLQSNNVYIKPSNIIRFKDVGISWRNSRGLKKWNWDNDVITYN